MKKKVNYKPYEIQSIKKILYEINNKEIKKSILHLEKLKDKIYNDIPDNYRISRGITWVLSRIGSLFFGNIDSLTELKKISISLYNNMEMTNILQGVPVFIMSHYGVSNPEDTFNFFKQMATSEDWVIREFITLAFKKITKNNKQIVSNWFLKIVKDSNPNVRRFVAETLRPVSENQWIQKEPEYSLKILKNLFKEKHKYPRTSIGNNLSDLSKKNPEMILKIVKELVDMKDENSYWIAFRACRNLIKKFPEKVMDLLKVDEYHYKDRNFYRVKP